MLPAQYRMCVARLLVVDGAHVQIVAEDAEPHHDHRDKRLLFSHFSTTDVYINLPRRREL